MFSALYYARQERNWLCVPLLWGRSGTSQCQSPKNLKSLMNSKSHLLSQVCFSNCLPRIPRIRYLENVVALVSPPTCQQFDGTLRLPNRGHSLHFSNLICTPARNPCIFLVHEHGFLQALFVLRHGRWNNPFVLREKILQILGYLQEIWPLSSVAPLHRFLVPLCYVVPPTVGTMEDPFWAIWSCKCGLSHAFRLQDVVVRGCFDCLLPGSFHLRFPLMWNLSSFWE